MFRSFSARTETNTADVMAAHGFKSSGVVVGGGEVTRSFTASGTPNDAMFIQVISKTAGNAGLCAVLEVGDASHAQALGARLGQAQSLWRPAGTENDSDAGPGPVYLWSKDGQTVRAVVHATPVKGIPMGSVAYSDPKAE